MTRSEIRRQVLLDRYLWPEQRALPDKDRAALLAGQGLGYEDIRYLIPTLSRKQAWWCVFRPGQQEAVAYDLCGNE